MEKILKINQPLATAARRLVSQEQWAEEQEKHLLGEEGILSI